MEKLATPFGKIDVLIDGLQIPYVAQEGEKDDVLWPDVLGRYQITVHFVPDGQEHTIACVFTPECRYDTDGESGEDLELLSFYNDDRFKLSIGLEGEALYWCNGKLAQPERGYDYIAEYLPNGMAYRLLPNTKTERYVFGICWIDDLGINDPHDRHENRGTQTWYGADPSLAL